ncbi:hypothetical protein VTK56DRAFT_57 [Thermocarpiscus australiensis]
MASGSLSYASGASPPMLSGHSGRRRYANAQDLPSYPSSGLKEGGAAASAAATLGWASSTPHTAYREPQLGASGSHDAILAAGWAQRHQSQQPSAHIPRGSPAAYEASIASGRSKTPPPAIESQTLARQNSMRAARGAMTGLRPRQSGQDGPVTDALSAATIAHRPSTRPRTISAGEVGAVPYTTMDRQMFTSNPPVKPETDEQKRADVLHASAIAMAKRMYDQQQKTMDSSGRAHEGPSAFPSHDAGRLSTASGEEETPVMLNSLQEAAYRRAQERLAKLQEEHQMRRLQEYYGLPDTPQRSRFGSIKNKLNRRRSSSDGVLLEAWWRSKHVRNQASLPSNNLTDMEEEVRAQNRDALLAAAHRNVKAQLRDMDERLRSEKGQVAQINVDDWGRKARAAAQARFDAANHENVGKVDVGGGKFMDRSEVEAIAARKAQPLLDEINERAEEEKQRRMVDKMEEERRKEEAERDKMREKEIQDIHKKLKEQQRDEERARKAEIRHEEKIRKDEAKATRAEQKQLAGEGKQKENEIPSPTTVGETGAEKPGQPLPEAENRRWSAGAGLMQALSTSFPKRQPRPKRKDSAATTPPPPAEKAPSTEGDSTSPTQKVRTWLRSRFSRPRAKSSSAAGEHDVDLPSGEPDTKKSFIGGVALARLQGRNASASSGEADERKGKERDYGQGAGSGASASASMREVAMAGAAHGRPGEDERGEKSGAGAGASGDALVIPPATPPRPLSQASVPVSVQSGSSLGSGGTSSGDDEFVEARSELETPMATPPPPPQPIAQRVGYGAAGRASPFRESRFSEILE